MGAQKKQRVNKKEEVRKALKKNEVRSYVSELAKGIEALKKWSEILRLRASKRDWNKEQTKDVFEWTTPYYREQKHGGGHSSNT